MNSDIEAAAALLRENGWTVLEPGSLDAEVRKHAEEFYREYEETKARIRDARERIEQAIRRSSTRFKP